MSYTPLDWSTAKLNAGSLEHIEQGIVDASGGGSTFVDASFTVSDYGLLGWTIQPEICSTQATMATGTATLTRMKIAVSGTVGNVYYGVTNAAAGLTKGRIQFYNTSGVLLGQTADMAAGWTAGDKETPIAVPFAVTAGEEIWAVIYALGTTGPTIRTAPISPSINVGLTSSSPVRTGRKTGVTTDLASITKTDFVAFSNQVPLFVLGA